MWRRLVYWQGTFGYPRLVITNYAAQPGSTPGTLDNTVASFSNASIVQIAEGVVTAFVPTPVTAVYPSVVQAVVVTCIDSAGLAFKLTIPAPKRSALAADGVTVKTATLASLLTAALLDSLVSPVGNAVVSMPSGLLNGPAVPGSTLD